MMSATATAGLAPVRVPNAPLRPLRLRAAGVAAPRLAPQPQPRAAAASRTQRPLGAARHNHPCSTRAMRSASSPRRTSDIHRHRVPAVGLGLRSLPCLGAFATRPARLPRPCARHAAPVAMAAPNATKLAWVETGSKDVLTKAVESGIDRFLFRKGQEPLVEEWKKLAGFEALYMGEDGVVAWEGKKVAVVKKVEGGEDIDECVAMAETEDMVVMDATGWQVIPAENLVASFSSAPAKVLAFATTAADARLMLEALEIGTDGVVLRTESWEEVAALAAYMRGREAERIPLCKGTVTRVEPVGMGDRACVDLCTLLRPGEGMLVGSFCAGLILVHSECMESNYIASRPFRVNAGPVHAYCLAPGGKTAYLSELESGAEVLVADGEGRVRSAVVGRVKIESRPLLLVEAEDAATGQRYSAILQNAETVRLVAPPGAAGGAVSVSVLKAGDEVMLHLPGGARHTGIKIDESIVEK